ncbi:LOW QUALITY PROTEIN: Leucine-rich repeat domain containing protein [Trema orientale]|uniref:Leucine-rich repeat domain containing protein n=1 Tax=Trema orientale TaxID=63057 RepID=A0A2P5FS57_TREOI|nr:LOW QUALITY PROTEIN: Leucine-rich repeat domain containing protein [Trema orientale]
MVSTMSKLPPQIAFLVMLLVYLGGANGSNAGLGGEPKIRCIEVERRALLKIKEDLHEIKEGFLSSWGNEEEKRDCCDWYGVQCANKSGHVIVLDLSPSTNNFSLSPYYEAFEEDDDRRFLRGNITHWLLELKYLTYLDLSVVNFKGNHIPSFIGTLSRLRYLNLSHTKMSGEIPPQLANLSSLQVLDLGYNSNLTMKNMEWVSHLTSLRLLDLSQTNMSKATDWMQTVSKLPCLANLQLSDCKLPSIVPTSLSLFNSSKSLAILDLSYNRLSLSVYQLMCVFSRSLVHLNLWENELEGTIPEAFQNLSALEYLELGVNELEGFIPEALGKMTTLRLRGLFARENNLTGLQLPEQTQLMSRCKKYSLEHLDLTWNRITGSLPNLTLFSSLKEVALALNQFSGTVPESIGQLAQLESLDLAANSLEVGVYRAWFLLGPQFPKWLQTQKNYSTLDISNAGISDSVPDWFWDLSAKCFSMDLSNNQIHGTVSNISSFEFVDYPEVDLSANNIEGSIPHFIFKVGALNLSMNRFSNLNSLCSVTYDVQLSYLDISYNQLSGHLPDCWSRFKELRILILANNKLSGKIPISIGSLTQIETLHLANNYLTKELPSSLKRNDFSGRIPLEIGKLNLLDALDLSNNQLFGGIPLSLSQIDRLSRLNLSNNNLSGEIPEMNQVTL